MKQPATLSAFPCTSKMTDDSSGDAASMTGSLLDGRYRLQARLGGGGMADVYLADDLKLGRQVAVKVIRAELATDPEFAERFKNEAEAAAQLNHGAIVAVYDRGRVGSQTYIVMEYVRGGTLRERLRRDGPLSPETATELVLALLAGLEHAHAHHIVHRDVTSHNVLISEDGRVKIADFGIARFGASAHTRTGTMLGTCSYTSPEQANGLPADPRSDLYSVGVVLFEMLTGKLPYTGDSDVAIALQHAAAPVPDLRTSVRDVPEALAKAVRKALAKDPADRYQSAFQFAAALRQVRERKDGDADRAEASNDPPASTASVCPPVPRPLALTSVAAEEATLPAAGPTRRMKADEAREAPPPPDRRRRMWRRLTAVLAVLAAAAAGWAAYTLLLAPGVVVPPLAGSARSEAVEALTGDGLTPVVHEVWDDEAAPGTVTRQRPRAGAQVDEGASVDIWVSKGALHIPSPDLAGLSAKDATRALKNEVLTSRRRSAASEEAPEGKVFKQTPAAGKTVTRGDVVTFWVSTGPPIVSVPDVVGLSARAAARDLEEAGFAVSASYVLGWGAYPGDVVGQDPAAGSELRKGDEVVIDVAIL
jgi:serine/threonine-protein kinase